MGDPDRLKENAAADLAVVLDLRQEDVVADLVAVLDLHLEEDVVADLAGIQVQRIHTKFCKVA